MPHRVTSSFSAVVRAGAIALAICCAVPATLSAAGWASVQAYAELTSDGTALVMCHYAFRTWKNMGRGWIDLHGHSHGRLKPQTRQYDVGVDVWDYRPVTLQTILGPRRRTKAAPAV